LQNREGHRGKRRPYIHSGEEFLRRAGVRTTLSLRGHDGWLEKVARRMGDAVMIRHGRRSIVVENEFNPCGESVDLRGTRTGVGFWPLFMFSRDRVCVSTNSNSPLRAARSK
jgi:hypothetical protein